MRSLVLIRHAKSSWSDSQLADFDRPLNDRGERDAPTMGQHLARKKFHTDILISSPALRAITTARVIAQQINYVPTDICENPAIYEADVDTLLGLIQDLNDEYRIATLVGHNPGFTYLCNYLTGENIDNIPTCGVAYIELNISSWKHAEQKVGTLNWFDYPKKGK